MQYFPQNNFINYLTLEVLIVEFTITECVIFPTGDFMQPRLFWLLFILEFTRADKNEKEHPD